MKIKPITYIICSFFLFFISCSDKKEIHVNCSKLEMYNYIKDFMKQEAEKGDVVTCLVENDSIWIRNKKGRLTEPDNIHSAIKELYLKNKIDDIAYSQDFDFRSEEHTSELQSRPHLVCRLLLEKKKYK